MLGLLRQATHVTVSLPVCGALSLAWRVPYLLLRCAGGFSWRLLKSLAPETVRET